VAEAELAIEEVIGEVQTLAPAPAQLEPAAVAVTVEVEREQRSTTASTQIRPSLTPSRSAIWRASSSFEQPRRLV